MMKRTLGRRVPSAASALASGNRSERAAAGRGSFMEGQGMVLRLTQGRPEYESKLQFSDRPKPRGPGRYRSGARRVLG